MQLLLANIQIPELQRTGAGASFKLPQKRLCPSPPLCQLTPESTQALVTLLISPRFHITPRSLCLGLSTPPCPDVECKAGHNHSLYLYLPSTPREKPHLRWVPALMTPRTAQVTLMSSDSRAHTGAHLQRSSINERGLVQKHGDD